MSKIFTIRKRCILVYRCIKLVPKPCHCVISPLIFGNSSFGSFTLTCDVKSSDEEEPCETLEEFEIFNSSNHLQKTFNIFLPR